jgi:hypothetical protein
MFIQNPLNESELSFPILECIHIVCFALSVGTIAIVDFRLLGLGMRHQTPAELLEDTWVWSLVGIVMMIFSGLLLFSSDPDMYAPNPAFNFKMAVLTLAILFNYTIRRKTASATVTPPYAKLVGLTSLTLWSAVVFGGIFIAFVNAALYAR